MGYIMKVLIADDLSTAGIEILKKEKCIQVNENASISHKELMACIGDYDALIVRSRTQVTSEVINAAHRLKVIGRAGVGVDNVDVHAATQQGILVVNTPGANTISAAEHTMSLILALSRNIATANASVKAGEWKRSKFMGVEISGKILGIIGLGRIGTEVAKRALSFGMKVIAADPYISLDHAKDINVELMETSEIFKRADYISFHLPLTSETYHIVGPQEFTQMKDGVRIINAARGGICDEKALYDAIVCGKVAGAALDVFENEPPKDSPLLNLDPILITPHLAASTDQAQINVAIEIADQVIRALSGQFVSNAVNMPPLEPEDAEKIVPYAEMAEKLGAFLSCITEGCITEVYIEYSGELTNLNTAIVSIGLQKGLVERFCDCRVNYVNASMIAREKGIKISQSKSSIVGDFSNLISVVVKTDSGDERRVSGTIFGRKDERIVEIDEFRVDVVPDGYILLVSSHHDKPGLMGKLGTILGDSGINIVTMSLAREQPGSESLVIINLDNPVPGEVMEMIKSIYSISEARLIDLS